jgi:hypothetical protein
MHRGVMTVEADYHWILTATPMINRISDYMGYLLIFWRDAWDYSLHGNDLARSYEPSFWAEVPSSYQYWINDTPLFVLNPYNFARLANRGELVGFLARNVLQAILRCIQLRRTKATPIIIDGRTVRIADSIPHYEIVTVELRMSIAQQRVYDGMYRFYANQLAKQRGVDDGNEGADDQPKRSVVQAPPGDRPPVQAPPPTPVITELGIRNNGMHRRLCLMTFDAHLEIFCTRSRGHSMAKDIEGLFSTCEDSGMSNFFALACPELGMLPPIDRFSFGDWMGLQSPKLQYICLYLHDLLFAHPYVTEGGVFITAAESKGETNFPVAEGSPAEGSDNASPETLDRGPTDIFRQKKSPPTRRRLLVFTHWPAVLWVMHGFLKNLGLNILVLRAGMDVSDLRDAISEFNDPDSRVHVLVASIQYATGLNLHKSCCEMIIVEVSLSTEVANHPRTPADLTL